MLTNEDRELFCWYGVLEIVNKCHMYHTGSFDYPEETYNKYIEYLKYRLETWEPSPFFTETYDNIVKTLINVLLWEAIIFKGNQTRLDTTL